MILLYLILPKTRNFTACPQMGISILICIMHVYVCVYMHTYTAIWHKKFASQPYHFGLDITAWHLQCFLLQPQIDQRLGSGTGKRKHKEDSCVCVSSWYHALAMNECHCHTSDVTHFQSFVKTSSNRVIHLCLEIDKSWHQEGWKSGY